jgi:hypothetical protein
MRLNPGHQHDQVSHCHPSAEVGYAVCSCKPHTRDEFTLVIGVLDVVELAEEGLRIMFREDRLYLKSTFEQAQLKTTQLGGFCCTTTVQAVLWMRRW